MQLIAGTTRFSPGQLERPRIAAARHHRQIRRGDGRDSSFGGFLEARGDTGPDNDATQQDWIEWVAATFPAEVCQNIVLLPVYRADGRK